MKILAIEKEAPHTQPADFQPHLVDEAAKVYELYLAGVVREFYFNESDHTSVLILECTDVNEARRVIGRLPMVMEGLISFDLITLVPYPGFSRLFKA